MASFTYELDTSPLARSVDTVQGHVRMTTGAVVAMEAAVVATERAASNQICENVDRGFYILVRSQISQKAAALYSEVASKLMIMKQLGEALVSMQHQMNNDFQMIGRRYHKLFKSLDKSLETRIKELDKPAMDVSKLKQNLILGRTRDSAAATILYDNDSLRNSQIAVTAKFKKKTKRTLSVMANDVQGNQVYNKTLEGVLSPQSIEYHENLCVPILYVETDSMFDAKSSVSAVYAPKLAGQAKGDDMGNAVSAASDTFSWKNLDEKEKNQIKNDFALRCSQSGLDERLSAEMNRLFDASAWSVIDGGKT